MITLKKIKKKYKEFLQHYKHIKFLTKSNNKVYYLDLPKNTKVRTFLNLIIRLQQQCPNCIIVVKFGLKKLFILSKWFEIIPNLYLSNPFLPISNKIVISNKNTADIKIRFDYQTIVKLESHVENGIPYIMHPSQYFGIHKKIKDTNKYSGIICAGNFAKNIYDDTFLNSHFKMLNRWEIYEHVKNNKNVTSINGRFYMKEYKTKHYINKLVLLEWQKGAIPSEDWLTYLSTFKFILCAPGMTMPMCHNILEAMRIGVVPITNYKDWLNPSLVDGMNCLIYTNQNSLDKVINKALSLSNEEYEVLKANCISYYQKYYENYQFEGKEFILLNETKEDII